MKKLIVAAALCAAILPRMAVAAKAPIRCDVVVVGGGSAGFAAALTAAEAGCSTVLIEKENVLGGTSTICGVNNWEPVCGVESGVPKRLYDALAEIDGACGIWKQTQHSGHGDSFPGALLEIDDSLTYNDTLVRHGPSMDDDYTAWIARYHGIMFEPDQLDAVMRRMLAAAGCRVLTGVSFVSVLKTDGNISELQLSDGRSVLPKVVVDCCGAVARNAGCEIIEYPEPNGVTLIFRVTNDADAEEVAVPEDTVAKRTAAVWCGQYPNGDLNINMLPTMTGKEALQLGPEAAYEECQKRVFAQWKWMQQTYPDRFAGWKIRKIFPRLAYRETCRVRCAYMLTGNDVKNGRRFDDEVATADHAFDSHGSGGLFTGELEQPYGIPLRSLKPIGVGNLYVAGRIAGFDRDAASSCRLSRTMMKLGEAAGAAAAQDVHAPSPTSLAVAVDGNTVAVTVPAGLATGEETLIVAYGARDYGAVYGSWPKRVIVAEGIPAAGGRFEANIAELGGMRTTMLRAFLVASPQLVALKSRPTGNISYIDLGEPAALDRRYEFRLRMDYIPRSCDFCPFGATDKAVKPTEAFQLFGSTNQEDIGGPRDSGDFYFNFYSSTASDGCLRPAFFPQMGVIYDIRWDIAAGSQKYYLKPADVNDYVLLGETKLASIPLANCGTNLYLFARNNSGVAEAARQIVDNDPMGPPLVTIFNYKVTQLSTGEVLHNFEPRESNGVGFMLDTVSSTEYRSATANTFECIYDSELIAVSAPVVDSAITTKLVNRGRTIRVHVAAGAVSKTSSLYLVWGATDCGETSVSAWDHSLEITNDLTDVGGTWEFDRVKLGIQSGDNMRVLVATSFSVRNGFSCSTTAYLDLGSAVLDRQYDIRFYAASGTKCLLGGLDGNKNTIIQIWGDAGVYSVWFGDSVKKDIATLTTTNALYDIRLVLTAGHQEVWYKLASESEYTKGPTGSVAALANPIRLALDARFSGSTVQAYPATINRFKETVVSTGEVLQDIVTVGVGSDCQVWDLVKEDVVKPSGGGSFGIDTNRMQPYEFIERPETASPVSRFFGTSGMLIMVR